MRKIVAGLHMSFDGVVQTPEAWALSYFNDEMGQMIGAQMAASDTLLLGRVTYETFADHWPTQSGDVPFADYMNTTPKLVASSTLDTVEWQNSTLLGGDVAARLSDLKQQPGKNIQITGSITLLRSLLRAGLVDELNVMICPIVLGRGERLFEKSTDQLPLHLVDATTLRTGVVSLTYAPAPHGAAEGTS